MASSQAHHQVIQITVYLRNNYIVLRTDWTAGLSNIFVNVNHCNLIKCNTPLNALNSYLEDFQKSFLVTQYTIYIQRYVFVFSHFLNPF